jgi:sugar phosphate permease
MNNNDFEIVLAIAALFVIVGLAVGIAYLFTLQRALAHCAPQNRAVSPGEVWLSLIPLFNLVWQFILVSRIADTLDREFQSRGGPQSAVPDDYGRGIGTTMCILSVVSIIPYLGILTGLAGLVCFIVYWVKIAGYSRLLAWGGTYPVGTYPAAPAPFAPAPERTTGSAEQVLVLLVLAFGYAGGYFQRLSVSYTSASIERSFHLAAVQIGTLFSVFAYGLLAGYVVMTAFTVLCGTRWGLVASFAGVSVAAIASGLVSNYTALLAARFALGLFSGGLLPAAVQSARDWFPSRVRPLLVGVVLASGQAAGLLMPPVFRLFAGQYEWRFVVMAGGVPTLIAAAMCLAVWPRPPVRAPFRDIPTPALASTGMLAAGLLFAWPIYGFAATWLPMYVLRGGMGTLSMASSFNAIQFAGIAGALLAGGIAWTLMDAEQRIPRMRAILLAIFGCLLLTVAPIGRADQKPLIVIGCALTMLAYNGWSTLLYSGVADTLPAGGVAIGAAIGAILTSLAGIFGNRYISAFAERWGYPTVLEASAAVAAIGVIGVLAIAWYAVGKRISY